MKNNRTIRKIFIRSGLRLNSFDNWGDPLFDHVSYLVFDPASGYLLVTNRSGIVTICSGLKTEMDFGVVGFRWKVF
jgi:hypothetical protein